MKKEEYEKLTSSMQDKLGKEYTAKVADDFATLLTDNIAMNNEIQKRDDEIKQLKEDKERLIQTNGNLLQKVSMGFEENNKKPNEEDKPKYSLKDSFDEKGNFK